MSHQRTLPSAILPASAAFLIAISLAAPPGTAAPGDEYWGPRYNAPGVNGSIGEMTPYQDGVILCGGFTRLGNTVVQRIALLTYEAGEIRITPFANELTYCSGSVVDFDGRLTVTGSLPEFAGTSRNGVCQWDGETWAELGAHPGYSVEPHPLQARRFQWQRRHGHAKC